MTIFLILNISTISKQKLLAYNDCMLFTKDTNYINLKVLKFKGTVA